MSLSNGHPRSAFRRPAAPASRPVPCLLSTGAGACARGSKP